MVVRSIWPKTSLQPTKCPIETNAIAKVICLIHGRKVQTYLEVCIIGRLSTVVIELLIRFVRQREFAVAQLPYAASPRDVVVQAMCHTQGQTLLITVSVHYSKVMNNITSMTIKIGPSNAEIRF
jgi:hypothetical protein